MANPSTKSNSSLNAAKSKLDSALDRLEKAIDTRPASSPGSSQDDSELGKELVAAKAEISELKEKNQVVSTRLDGAIGRMKEILES